MHDDIRSGRSVRPINRRNVCPRPSIGRIERSVYKTVASSAVSVKPVMDVKLPVKQHVVAHSSPKEPVQVDKPKVFLHHAALGSHALRHALSAEQPKHAKHSLRQFMKSYKLVYAASALIFVAGALTVVQGITANQEVNKQAQVLSSSTSDGHSSTTQSSDEAPSEEKLKASTLSAYKVAADLPRVISIPALGVQARVLQVGVDSDNQLMTPKNIFDTAWYTGSSKPGEMGATLIDGHYSGVSSKGVFGQLKKLKVGDQLTIERGDGTKLNFSVTVVETVPTGSVDMAKLLVSNNGSLPGLNLITCGGKFDSSSHQFTDRTVVYAVLSS